MQNENKPKRTKIVLGIALSLILVGGLLAHLTQTDCGKVKVSDVRFTGSNGMIMSGLLYVPKGVTANTPGLACFTIPSHHLSLIHQHYTI
jgi:Fe-S cluster assembly scaffold protein SufB